MSSSESTTVQFSFSASLDLVGLVREYVSQLLLSQGFSEGFSYRTEIIVDELWRNAVTYGLQSPTSRIETILQMFDDRLLLSVLNEGGTPEELARFQQLMNPRKLEDEETLGLSIVRVLTNSIAVDLRPDGRLRVTVERKKVQ